MSLLEIITKASSAIPAMPDQEFDYPVLLNPYPILSQLKPETDDLKSEGHIKKATGWEISQIDHKLIELGKNFFKNLRRKLKNPKVFRKEEFLNMVTSYIENCAKKVGIWYHLDKSEPRYTSNVIERFGGLMARDVKCLVAWGCIVLGVWDMLEALIIKGLVDHAFTSTLVNELIEKRKSDLVVSCVKHLPNLQAYELMCILKFFLILPGDGYESLVSLRKYWESQALLAIDKCKKGKENSLAKEAALLVMLAHDGFSVSELCLHYLLASPNLDEMMLSACVRKLSGEEIKALVQYLGKWLEKYNRFPQVVPCPNASSGLGLTVCEWIPSLETVVKCLGVVIDEHFLSMVLHSESGEWRSLEGVVGSLAAEARLCGGLAYLVERFREEH